MFHQYFKRKALLDKIPLPGPPPPTFRILLIYAVALGLI